MDPTRGNDNEELDVGLLRVGHFARRQLHAAERDPRLDRGEGALIADYLDYLDEADRVRVLAIGAITALAQEPLPTDGDVHHRQAAWERAQLARLEDANGHPHINALTLVGMFGNLDGFVEQLVPVYREMELDAIVDAAMRKAISRVDESPDVESHHLEVIKDAVRSAISDMQPRLRRPNGSAPARWEKRLSTVGLGAAPSHPLPGALTSALTELTALRHVLVHRAGRIDSVALRDCPRLTSHLGYQVGDFVRLDRRAYRRYSAALRAYGLEVQRRLFARTSADLKDVTQVDLEDWEAYYYLGA